MTHDPVHVVRRLGRLVPALAALSLAALSVQVAFAAGPTLRSLADAKGVKIGTALAANHLSADATYASIAGAQFNSTTPENEMKWGVVEPTRNQFNWSGADQIVSFAQAHSMRVRGHNLVWHSQLPSWVNSTNFPGTSALTLMQQHIATEVGRYKGRAAVWDVVNEPFNDNGSLRSDIFEQQAGGSGYIATALRAAHQADNAAKLFINDFNIEGVNAKSTAMLNLVRSLKQQGVPIDGVGFESHFILGQVPSSLQQNIARFTALGVSVEITELDVRMQLPATSAKLSQQANDYRTVVSACLAVSGCRAITIWEYTDKYSWVPGTFSGQGAADIYDANLQTKPSYTAVQQVL